ncbi:MAG: tetratricopeptide repeat protein, partial [Noviherbaspirillum sp.]
MLGKNVRNALADVGKLLPIACCVPVLIGCATPAGGERSSGVRIEPVLSIRNSSEPSAARHYQIGRYFQGQNRLDQAAQAYQKALEADIRHVDAHSALGTVYASQGRFDDAIREFEAALKLVPELASLYNNLGYANFLQGKYAEAIEAFEKAIKLEPNNVRAFNNLGAAYARAGESAKSEVAYAGAKALRPSGALARESDNPAPVKPVEENRSLPALTNGPAVTLESASGVSADLTARSGEAAAMQQPFSLQESAQLAGGGDID